MQTMVRGMWRQRVQAFSVGLTLFGASSLVRAQCVTDNDCKGDRICEAGQCTAPPPAATPVAAPAAAAPAAAPAPAPAPAVPAAAPPAGAPVAAERPYYFEGRAAEQWERQNKPLMVLGIVSTSIGGFLLLLDLLAVGSCSGNCTSDVEDRQVAVAVVGATFAAAGIPMMIYGSKKVPVQGAALSPWVTSSTAGLRLRLDL